MQSPPSPLVNVSKAPQGPFPESPLPPSAIRAGNPRGRGADLMQSDDRKLTCGIWTYEPGEFEWVFGGDEFLMVLEGEVTIRQDPGESHALRAGDIIFFPRGARTHWKITRPLKEYFVIRTPEARKM